MIPKPKREVDKKYLEYIKTLPCCCQDHTCTGDIVPHHTKTRGSGGSDYKAVPMCATHHSKVHNTGYGSFQVDNSIDFEYIICKCLIGYIKKLEG